MGTRVTGPGNGWFVKESVDEVKALIDPKLDPIQYEDDFQGVKWRPVNIPPRFVDLTPLRATAHGPISITVAHIIALEPYHD